MISAAAAHVVLAVASSDHPRRAIQGAEPPTEPLLAAAGGGGDRVCGAVSDSTATVIGPRSDISDTLPGVAIAISLVPLLAVVGLTLESGAPRQSLGSFLLFVTNVAAILASGIAVMAFHRVLGASALRAPVTAAPSPSSPPCCL